VSTKIKLMRRGKTRQPYYRIVVADSRTKRDGRSIEEIGKYHPKEDPSYMEVDADRVAYWLGVGAQPTEAVRAILRVTGDWQKFYGEPAPEPMLVKAAKPDRRAAFEAATQLGGSAPEDETSATTPKKKAKAAEPKGDGQAEKADKTDVEVDVEAASPRAGVRQVDGKAVKTAAAPDPETVAKVAPERASKRDAPTQAGVEPVSDHSDDASDDDSDDDKADGSGILSAVVKAVDTVVGAAADVVTKVVNPPADDDAAKGDAAKGDAAKGDAAKGDAAKGDAAKPAKSSASKAAKGDVTKSSKTSEA